MVTINKMNSMNWSKDMISKSCGTPADIKRVKYSLPENKK